MAFKTGGDIEDPLEAKEPLEAHSMENMAVYNDFTKSFFISDRDGYVNEPYIDSSSASRENSHIVVHA